MRAPSETLQGKSYATQTGTPRNTRKAQSDDLPGLVREAMQPTHATLWLCPDTVRRANRQVRGRVVSGIFAAGAHPEINCFVRDRERGGHRYATGGSGGCDPRREISGESKRLSHLGFRGRQITRRRLACRIVATQPRKHKNARPGVPHPCFRWLRVPDIDAQPQTPNRPGVPRRAYQGWHRDFRTDEGVA